MKITVIGLGYVGLPLARLFATKYAIVGFDVNQNRIAELRNGNDKTLEVSEELLKTVIASKNPQQNEKGLYFTSDSEDIRDSNIYIVTVPTPVDKNNKPDFAPLYSASELVGKVLKKDDIVIYESTVFPGATEEECVPVLEKFSGLKFNQDFFVGYSPERINPGDKEHTVEKILKITSGSTPETAKKVDELYQSVLLAGTHLAPSIKVAEAAKVIENTQRDVNIAFVNELSKIFNLMGIDTHEVLKAAGTKWNFLPFKPGLVGGHCTGVDPYYLAHKAIEFDYHPEIILAGRRMNDSMGNYVASETVKQMLKKDSKVKNSEILVLGFAFKENCTDFRNTKVTDIVKNLQEFGANVTVYDSWINAESAEKEYNVKVKNTLPNKKFEAIVLAVPHQDFLNLNLKNLLLENGIIYDVKGILPKSENVFRL